MDIKYIVDKALKESDVQAQDWPVSERLADVNVEYRIRVEKAVQIGSKIPASAKEDVSETFSVVAGSNEFDRTIVDVPVVRLDFMPTGGSRFEKVTRDQSRSINGWCWGDIRGFFDEKRVFIENGVSGTLRVTYGRGALVTFDMDDYEDETPPSPDFLPEVFHPLLWLVPALAQAEYYKKDRVSALQRQVTRLEALFDNHYGRDAIYDGQIVTDEDDSSCFGNGNGRR
jgi:hypothetical protein